MDFNESKTVKVFKILAAISVAAVTVLGFAASPASAIREDVVESDVLCIATEENGVTHLIVIGSIVYNRYGCSGFRYDDSLDGRDVAPLDPPGGLSLSDGDFIPFETEYACTNTPQVAGGPNSQTCEYAVNDGGGVYQRTDVDGSADPTDCLWLVEDAYVILGEKCAY